MASRKRKRVVIAAAALDELAEIWHWNAKRYSPRHADAYVAFLKKGIDSLSTRFAAGRKLSQPSDLQYAMLRRTSKGHGHLAVYRVDDESVNVFHVFHTAQDWQAGTIPPTRPQ